MSGNQRLLVFSVSLASVRFIVFTIFGKQIPQTVSKMAYESYPPHLHFVPTLPCGFQFCDRK